MKIVIDIDEEIYEMVLNTGTFGKYRFNTARAIKNGTPLPENNGRLIDADAFMEYCQNNINKTVDCNDIARFPTIIEAEKESEEEEWIHHI